MSKKQTPTEVSKQEVTALMLEAIKREPGLYMVKELNSINRRMEELSSMVENIFDIVRRGPSADRFNEIQKSQRTKPLAKER